MMEDTPRYAEMRRKMVERQIRERGIRDPKVLQAFLKVPRHLFVEEALRDRAYDDSPLPIGDGQTISQPYTVAFMTEALKLEGGEKVLEIGCGSGYQTAILLEMVPRVFTVERIASIARRTQKLLNELNYTGAIMKVGDGSRGWLDFKPYEAIIVAAASPQIPNSLKDQLATGGRLVIPVGDRFTQDLVRVTRKDETTFVEENLGAFRFVGLIGAEGFSD